MKLWQKNLILFAFVVLLCVFPLIFMQGSEFAGADGEAETLITEIQPEYEPWFSPLFEPASGEVESLLFALQALIGGAVIGFGFGRLSAKYSKKDKAEGQE